MKFIRSLLALSVCAVFVCSAFSQTSDFSLVIKTYPTFIGQGQSFLVRAYPSEKIKAVSGKFFGKDIPFFPEDGHFRSIVGVPLGTIPGNYKMTVTGERHDGSTEQHEHFVQVKSVKFPKISFWLKPSMEKLLSSDIVEADWAKIEKEIVRNTKEKLWSSAFVKPAYGTVSMYFGTKQVINGSLSGQHRGLDIAGKSYYRVRAANVGQVVFADYLRAFGNTVVINHGQGVFSLYFHLSKISVKKNDIVWKGALLGRMGSTGVSTGVHLHWAMSVQDVRVDPLQWTYGDLSR